MADMTNISDFDPATGKTTTTLVATHDRGAMDWAEQEAIDDHSGGTPPPVATSLAPTSGFAILGCVITITGTGFAPNAVGLVDNGAIPLMSQRVVTPGTVHEITVDFTGHVASHQIGVANGSVKSNTLTYNAVVLADDELTANVGDFTIAQIQAHIDADHDALADEVLAAEQARGEHARSTLITWLQGFIAARDED